MNEVARPIKFKIPQVVYMPLTRFKHTILEADTRPLEMFLGSFSIVWALWLAIISKDPYPSSFWDAIGRLGGPNLWAVWAGINGLLQLNAIWFEKFKLRRFSASGSSVYWIMAAWCLMRTEPKMFIITMSALLAVGNLWIVLRRAALGR